MSNTKNTDTKATKATKAPKAPKAVPEVFTKAGTHPNPFTPGSLTAEMFSAAASANGVSVAELAAMSAKRPDSRSGSVSRNREILVRPANYAAAGKPTPFRTVWSIRTVGSPSSPDYRYFITESALATNGKFAPKRERE